MDLTFGQAVAQFIVQSIVFILIAAFVTKKVVKLGSLKKSLVYLGLNNKKIKNNSILGIIIGFLMPLLQLLLIVIVAVVVSLVTQDSVSGIVQDYYGAIVNSNLSGGGVLNTIIIMVVMLLFVGLGEEIFFRGMIQKGLVNKLGVRTGLVLTAVIFTLMHGFYMLPLGAAIASATALFGISMLFGILKVKTSSLIPSVIAHGLGNAMIYGIFAKVFYELF